MTQLNVRPSKRTFAIGFYLLSGRLPWGVELTEAAPYTIVRCGAESGCAPVKWIVCCGHVLADREVVAWKGAGLAVDGPKRPDGRSTLVAGPSLERWISTAWHDLQVRTWRHGGGQ